MQLKTSLLKKIVHSLFSLPVEVVGVVAMVVLGVVCKGIVTAVAVDTDPRSQTRLKTSQDLH